MAPRLLLLLLPLASPAPACECTSEAWLSVDQPSANCTLAIDRTCAFDMMPGACVLADYIRSPSFRAWLNHTAAACGQDAAMFSEAAQTAALDAKNNLPEMDAAALAFTLLVDAPAFGMPRGVHERAYAQRMDGPGLLAANEQELIALGISDEELAPALAFRREQLSACACVEEPWTFVGIAPLARCSDTGQTGGVSAMPTRCSAQMRSVCAATARTDPSAACKYASYLAEEEELGHSNFFDEFLLPDSGIVAQLLRCPGKPPYISLETLQVTAACSYKPPWEMITAEWAFYTFYMPGYQSLPKYAPDGRRTSDVFYENDASGQVMFPTWADPGIGEAAMEKMGFDVVTSVKYREFLTIFMNLYKDPPVSYAADGSALPVTIHMHVRLDRLSQISAPTHFEAELSVAMSWEDSRISADCREIPIIDGKVDTEQAVCRANWIPEFELPTALGNDDAPELLGDPVLSYYPGSGTAGLGGWSLNAGGTTIPGLTKSFGTIHFRLRARWFSTMSYSEFPIDTQNFNATFALKGLPASTACIEATAESDIPPRDEHPMWTVTTVTPVVTPVRHLEKMDTEKMSEASPIVKFRELLDAASTTDETREAYAPPNDMACREMSCREMSCRLVIVIEAKRYLSYYIWNYIAIEIVLVLLGFSVFALPPDSLDTRLSVSMTLVLAINVFQIVIVENTPETGYLSIISMYTVCNTVLLALFAVQSITMAQFFNVVVRRQALHDRLRELQNKEVALSAVTRLQRLFRRRKIRYGRFKLASSDERKASTRPSFVSRLSSVAPRRAPVTATATATSSTASPRIHLAETHVHIVTPSGAHDAAVAVEAVKVDAHGGLADVHDRAIEHSTNFLFALGAAHHLDNHTRIYMLRQRMRRERSHAVALAVTYGDKVCGLVFAIAFAAYSASRLEPFPPPAFGMRSPPSCLVAGAVIWGSSLL